MTEVLFYHLEHQPLDRVLPSLLEKTLERGWRAVVQSGSQERLEALDMLLWTYRDDSFLPHDREETGELITPILINDNPDPDGERQLLINLSASVPSYFAQFERVIELVTEENKTQARAHYSYYKERGYPLKHINL